MFMVKFLYNVKIMDGFFIHKAKDENKYRRRCAMITKTYFSNPIYFKPDVINFSHFKLLTI